jgi:hypothetical protein
MAALADVWAIALASQMACATDAAAASIFAIFWAAAIAVGLLAEYTVAVPIGSVPPGPG